MEDTEDAGEFVALTTSRDIAFPVSFEMPVKKFSKTSSKGFSSRIIGLTSSAIIERDIVTRRTVTSHSIADIFNIVVYPSTASHSEYAEEYKEEEDDNNQPDGMFAIEFKSGRTKKFSCEECFVTVRSPSIGIGFSKVTKQDKDLLKRKVSTTSSSSTDTRFNVAGATEILSPNAARNVLLCNIFDLCNMNNIYISWSTMETPLASKEGTWNTSTHPEYEEILLKKMSSLSTTKSFVEIERTLLDFNSNIPLYGLKQRDRRAFSTLMKFIENYKDLPGNITVLILLALLRLLCTKPVFDEVANSQHKAAILNLIKMTDSSDKNIAFGAASVLKNMVVHISEHKNARIDSSNRRTVFVTSNATEFVQRAMGFAKEVCLYYYKIILFFNFLFIS